MKIARPYADRDDLLRALLPLAAIFLAWAAMAVSWFTREFTHDDFYLAYLAWIRTTPLVPGQDYVVPNFTALAEFASPMFRAFEGSLEALDRLRLVMLVIASLLAGLTIEVARRLSGSLAWGTAAGVILCWHPQIIFRAADIRTDTIAAAVLMAAIAILLGERPRPLILGLLGGLAAVLSPKIIIAVPFLAAALALAARPFLIGALARFGAGAAIAPAAYFGIRIAVDGWATVARVFGAIGSSAGDAASTSRASFLWNMAGPVPAIAAIVAVGGLALAVGPWAFGTAKKASLYVATVASFTAVFLLLNPAPYVYNALVLVPLVAPCAGGVALLAGRYGRGAAETAALALVTLLAVVGGIPALGLIGSTSNAHQRNLVAWIEESTSPADRVFDWQGMHLGRRGVYHWWTYKALLRPYYGGSYRMRDEWRRARVSLVVPNYRLNWLAPGDVAWLRARFVPLGPCALVPGRRASREDLRRGIPFDAVAPGLYEIVPSGTAILIDGRTARSRTVLGEGRHMLAAAGADVPADVTIRYRGARKRLPPCSPEPLLRPFPLYAPPR